MRKRWIALFVAMFALTLASVGYAVWSSSQQGAANTRIGQPGSFTLTPGPPPGAAGGPPPTTMVSGPGASGSGSIIVTNTSSAPMTLASWAGLNTPAPSSDVSVTTCPVANFIPNTAVHNVSITLPPGVATTVELPGALTLAATAPIGCAGANVTFSVNITVTQGS